MNKICPFCRGAFNADKQMRVFCSIACSNRSHRNRLKNITLPKLSNRLAELVGIILGDGSLNGYQLRIALNSDVDRYYIPYVQQLVQDLFPEAKVLLRVRVKYGYTEVCLYSIEVIRFFESMGICSGKRQVPKWIFTQTSYVAACTRGLFDTEGSVSYKEYRSKIGVRVYKQLAFTSCNIVLLNFVAQALETLEIFKPKSFAKNIYLSNNTNVSRYIRLVGFGNPKLASRASVNTM